MRNNLKSPLYFYIQTQLKSKNVAYIGGQKTILELIDLLESSIEDCCFKRIKTNNTFLNNSQLILKQYSFPKDKLKLQFIIDRLLTPFINCCKPENNG